MAIIYETQKDFERDKLKDQARNMSFKSSEQMGNALAASLLGVFIDSANTKKSVGLNIVSGALAAVGIVELVHSLISRSKARDLRLQHERMGPQTVILPPEIPAAVNVMQTMNDKACCGKRYSQTIQPATLLEHAAKPEATLARE